MYQVDKNNREQAKIPGSRISFAVYNGIKQNGSCDEQIKLQAGISIKENTLGQRHHPARSGKRFS